MSAGSMTASGVRPDPAAARLDLVGHDLYRDVHKGIRAELFAITGELGRLDPGDAGAAHDLLARTQSLFVLLDAHARHEDEVIGPVLTALAPALDRQVRDEHDSLDALADVVRTCASQVVESGGSCGAVDARRWYLAMASFTSDYLAHEATEELLVSPVLAEALGDAGVADLESAIVAMIEPDQFAGYLRLILPATSPSERLALARGIRAGTPPEVFAGVLDIAHEVLDGHQLELLQTGLDG